MPFVEVDVDLDDFNTDDLVDEIITRLGRYSRKRPTDKEIDRLKDSINNLCRELKFTPSLVGLEVKTLDDKLKMELIASIWNKYNSADLSRMLITS